MPDRPRSVWDDIDQAFSPAPAPAELSVWDAIDQAVASPVPTIGNREFPRGGSAGGTFGTPIAPSTIGQRVMPRGAPAGGLTTSVVPPVTPVATGPSLEETLAAKKTGQPLDPTAALLSQATSIGPVTGTPPRTLDPHAPMLRSRTGQLYQPTPIGTMPVLDAPITGGQQIAAGAKAIGAAAVDQTPVAPSTEPLRRSRTGTLYQAPGPIDKRLLTGTADIMEGAFQALEPVILGTALAAPVPVAAALVKGTVAAQATQTVLSKLGVSPEATRVMADIAGAVGAGAPLRETLADLAGRARERGQPTRIKPEPSDIDVTAQIPRPEPAAPVTVWDAIDQIPKPDSTLESTPSAPINTGVEPPLPAGAGPHAYAGPERRAAHRVSTPEADAHFAEMREKLAHGEQTGTAQSREDFANRQRVEEGRKSASATPAADTFAEIDTALERHEKRASEMSDEELAAAIMADVDAERAGHSAVDAAASRSADSTRGTDASDQVASPAERSGSAHAGRDAEARRDSPSAEGSQSPVLARTPETHFPTALRDARADGYTGTDAELRSIYDDHVRSVRELTDDLDAVADKHGDTALLRDIRAHGGLKPYTREEWHGRPGGRKIKGDLAAIIESFASPSARNLRGGASPFRVGGHELDALMDRLHQGGKWADIPDENALLERLDRISRTAEDAGAIDTELVALLHDAAGVRPGEKWWEDDDSFDVDALEGPASQAQARGQLPVTPKADRLAFLKPADAKGYSPVPFEVADAATQKAVAEQADYHHPALEMVPIDKLIATQSTVTRSVVEEHLERPTAKLEQLPAGVVGRPRVSEVPTVLKSPDGTLYLGDGTHRVLAAKARGETHVQAIVYPTAHEGAKAPHEFSSTQVELPEKASAAARAMAATIPDSALADDGRENEPHITVKFGLHTNDVADVRRVLAGQGPITVRLGKTSIFPSSETKKDYDVVKVDVDSPDLHALNKKIAAALEHTDTHDYKPHATLAYVKAGLGQQYAGRTDLEGQTITLHELTFSGKDRQHITIPLTGKGQIPVTPKAAATDHHPETREPYDRDVAQRRYVKFKAALTRAVNAKDWPAVIAQHEAFVAHYESSPEPYPDAWSRWERAADDARIQIAREARDNTGRPLAPKGTLPVTPKKTAPPVEEGVSPFTTPGTRLSWGTGAEWVDAYRELKGRHISSKMHRDLKAHLDELAKHPDFITAQPREDLEAIKAIVTRVAPPKGSRAGTAYERVINEVNNALARLGTAKAPGEIPVTPRHPGKARAEADARGSAALTDAEWHRLNELQTRDHAGDEIGEDDAFELEELTERVRAAMGLEDEDTALYSADDLDRMPVAEIMPTPAKTIRMPNLSPQGIEKVRASGLLVTQAEAAAQLATWKAEATRIGETEDHSQEVVLSLFDRTGGWSQPYVDAGYDVRRYDIANGHDLLKDFPLAEIAAIRAEGKTVIGVLAAPPCTSFAVSGARWWADQHDKADVAMVEKKYGYFASKYFDTPLEYGRMLVAAVQFVVDLAHPTQFHAMENPVGRIAEQNELPDPLLTFDPANFGDPYTKKTLLWGAFNTDLPQANVEPTKGSAIAVLRGDNAEQKAARSITPEGFAYAFFMANHQAPRVSAALDPAKYHATQRGVAYADMTPAELRELIDEGLGNEQSLAAAELTRRKEKSAAELSDEELAKQIMADVAAEQTAALEPQGPVVPYSKAAIREAFHLTADQAEAVDALKDAMDLQTPLTIVRGGLPGDGALTQKKDLLDTGETQPRLPGDAGDVRESDTATPEFEDKFALGGLVSTRKAKQEGLFELEPPAKPKTGELKKKGGQDTLFQGAEAPFYSRLTRTVEQSQLAKASGQQWKATIKNSKLGTNQDEYVFAHVDDLADGTTYTKAEVLDYLRANELRVEPVILGGAPDAIADGRDIRLIRAAGFDVTTDGDVDNVPYLVDNNGEPISSADWGFVPAGVRAAMARLETLDGQRTHYDTYQEPGADEGSYREVLLTLPPPPPNAEASEAMRAVGRRLTSHYLVIGAYQAKYRSSHRDQDPPSSDPTMVAHVAERDRILAELQTARERVYGAPRWHDGHSDYEKYENPIVRLRFNVRTGPEEQIAFNDLSGKGTTAYSPRTMFLEEVQPPGPDEQKKMPALLVKHWREIAFKWALRYAAENGLDAVAWTTGEMQAQRYSLEKQVLAIEWKPVLKGSQSHKGGAVTHVDILTKEKNRLALSVNDQGVVIATRQVDETRWAGAPLENVLGKEVAKKILDAKEGELAGEGLKIGGEGLKKLYDVDFRNVVNSLPAVKKTAGKVGTTEILPERAGSKWRYSLRNEHGIERRGGPTEDDALAQAETHHDGPWTVVDNMATVPSLTITPALYTAVMGGQPLFQGAKGAVEFSQDGKALLRALEGADVSTAIHEIGHVARRELLNRNVPAANRHGITDDMILMAEEAFGATGGTWDVDAEEKFSRGLERYLVDGEAPTPELRSLFEKIRDWLLAIYQRIKGSLIDVELTPNMREVFDALLTRKARKPPPSTPAREALIDRIVAASRKPAPDVVEQTETLGTNGKWYLTRANSMPFGVSAATPRQTRSVGFAILTRDGTTVGTREATRQAVLDRATRANDKIGEEFRGHLREMTDERLASQREYWLKESAVPVTPKKAGVTSVTPVTPKAAKKPGVYAIGDTVTIARLEPAGKVWTVTKLPAHGREGQMQVAADGTTKAVHSSNLSHAPAAAKGSLPITAPAPAGFASQQAKDEWLAGGNAKSDTGISGFQKPAAAGSWKAELTDGSGWSSNALRFATKAEAEAAGRAIMDRWFAAKDIRVVESTDPVTHRRENNENVEITAPTSTDANKAARDKAIAELKARRGDGPKTLLQADEPIDVKDVVLMTTVLRSYVADGLTFPDAVRAFQADYGEGARKLDRHFEMGWKRLQGADLKVADVLTAPAAAEPDVIPPTLSAQLYAHFKPRFGALPTNNVELKAELARAFPGLDPAANTTLNAATDAIEAVLASALSGPDMADAQTLEGLLTRAYRTPEKMRLQQFSTPLPIAVQAALAAHVRPTDRVLEPTAGTGNLLAPLLDEAGIAVTALEIDPSRVALLKAQGWHAVEGNYLSYPVEKGSVDVIIANPPWGKYTTKKYGQAIAGEFEPGDVAERFVAKMVRELKPGGRLVAVMPTTMLGRSGVAFRGFLDKHGEVRAVIQSPPGAYDTRGTSVESILLVFDKRGAGVTLASGEKIVSLDTKDWAAYTAEVGRIPDRASTLERPVAPTPGSSPKSERPAQPRPGSTGPRSGGGVPGPAGHPVRPPAQRPAPVVAEGRQPLHEGRGDAGGEPERPLRSADDSSTRGLTDEALVAYHAAEGSDVFSPYQLRTSLAGVRHPRLMVEARGLAGVAYPPLTYHPSARFERIIADGRASIEQAEQSLAAVQANVDGGHGYLAADNVGVGKAREAWLVAIELIQRAKKAGTPLRLLLTTKGQDNIASLIADELPALVGDAPGFEIVEVSDYKESRVKPGKRDEAAEPPKPLPRAEYGVYMIDSYNIAPYREALLDVGLHGIIGDEAHRFKNADAQVGAAWQQLHARIFATIPREQQAFAYFTATPAQSVEDYQYLYGLRMWPIDGFDDWVAMVTGQATEEEAAAIRAAADADTGAFDSAAVSDNDTDAVVGGDSADTAHGPRPGLSGGDVFASRLTPAEGEQITREWKRLGRFSSRDLWRKGTEFVVQTEQADTTAVARYDEFTGLARAIVQAATKFGKKNKAVRSSIGGVKSQLQFAAKRILMQPSLEAGVRLAHEYLASGHQVVLSLINVSEFDAENGNIAAAINQINMQEVEVTDAGDVINHGDIPEALQVRADLLERSAELGKLPSPIEFIEEAFGPDKVAFVIGDAVKGRAKHVAQFQAGERTVAVISAAGSTGISLDHRIETPTGAKGRRVFIDVQFDWSATEAIQRYGRVDRAGQISAPKILALNFGTAAEKKFLSTIANRLASLGALSKGGAESTGTDLEEFEIDGNESNAAARIAWNALDVHVKDLFVGSKFRDPRAGADQAASRTQATIKDIMLGLLFVPTDEAARYWDSFLAERERIRGMQVAGATRRTNAAKGEILRTLVLTPELTLYQVKNANAEKFGILTGVVMPEMPRLRDFLRDRNGDIARQYTAFTAGNDVVAGLVVAWGRVPGLATFYGRALKAEKLDTLEKIREALKAGDVLDLQQQDEKKRPWRLRQRKDNAIAIDGVKMADLKLVTRHGVVYHAAGNWWEAQDLAHVVERFPLAAPKVEAHAHELEDRDDEPPANPSRGGGGSGGVESAVIPGLKQFVEQDVTPGLKAAAEEVGAARHDIRALFAPDTLSDASRLFAGVMRANLAAHHQRVQRAQKTLRALEVAFDKRSNDDNLAFMDAIEDGQVKTLPPALQAAATELRALLAHKRSEVQKRGRLHSYIENYFPHEWAQPGKAKQILARLLGRRPLEGPKSFLKKRTIPTVAEGIKLGLTPASYNPVTLVLHKLTEMDKWIMAHDALRDAKNVAVAKFIRVGGRKDVPAGWNKYPESFGTVYGKPTVPIKEAYDEKLMEALYTFAHGLGVKTVRKVSLGGQRWGYAVTPGTLGGAGNIVTKFAGPETVLMHEIGHILDDRYGLRGKWVNRKPEAKDPMQRELRVLADLRHEGTDRADLPISRQRYYRKGEEKMANLVHAFIYIPERAKAVAPNAYWALYNLAKDTPELRPLIALQQKRSLVMGVQGAEARVPGMVISGYYYGPPEATRLLTNYLSPGLRGNVAFDLYRRAGNFMNQVQLGLSAFHLTMTGLEAVVSKAAQALQETERAVTLGLRGEGRRAGTEALFAAKHFAQVPVATFLDLFRGHQALKEFYKTDANARTLAGVTDTIIQGGGGVGWDKLHHDEMPAAVLKAFRQGNYIGAAWRTIPAVLELTAKPIMEWWVPRLKLGAYLDMVAMEQRTLGEYPTLDEVRRVYGRAWDAIDDRFGELRYDNLFWHTALKDAGMGSFRALGWNIGTVRTVAGAPSEQITRLLKGTRDVRMRHTGEDADGRRTYAAEPEPWLTTKASYVVAMVMLYGLLGALYQLTHTGELPRETRDYFFPKTGHKKPDGTPERVSIPGYFKDAYAFLHDFPQSGVTTIGHKLHPLLNAMLEIFQNEDYWGTEVRTPGAPMTQQARELATFFAELLKPISLRNYARREESLTGTGIGGVESIFGISEAPASVSQSKAEALIRKYTPSFHRTLDQAEAAAQTRAIRDGLKAGTPAGRDAAKAAALSGLITQRQVQTAVRASGASALQRGFQRLTLDQALHVYEVATEAERTELRPLLERKSAKVGEAAPQDRADLTRRVRAAAGLPYQQRDRLPVTAPAR